MYQRMQILIRSIAISSPVNNDPILLSSHSDVLRTILYHLDFQLGLRWKEANGAFLKLGIQADGQIG